MNYVARFSASRLPFASDYLKAASRRARRRQNQQRMVKTRVRGGQKLEDRKLLAGDVMAMDHADHQDDSTDTTMVHHTPKMMAEMQATFDLVSLDDVTATAVKSGRWLDGATWGGADKIPAEGDRVRIPENTVVVVNGEITTRLRTVRVDGTLRFAAARDTELHVDTMVVMQHGILKIGTTERPIHEGKTAKLVIDDFDGGFETRNTESPDYDPYKLGNGLISHGRVSIVGVAKTSHATLAADPSDGDLVLVFDALPADWAKGDSIVIAGTNSDATGHESRTIEAIDTAAGSVTLDSALGKDHHTPDHTKQGVSLKVHVANLTRNAVIETAAKDRGTTGLVGTPEKEGGALRTGDSFDRRGHVMFMHNNDVEIRNGGFYHLGRTNKEIPVHDTHTDDEGDLVIGKNPRARYPIHFHRAGTGESPAIVSGSAVSYTPGWGFVNHSSYVDMTSNVSFDATGAGFVTEAGDERGSFVGNLSIYNKGSDIPINRRNAVDDFGHGGNGFWFQGTGITVNDNVASGSKETGIVMWPIGIDGLGDTVRDVTVESFQNNTIYGSKVGFLLGQHQHAGSHFVGTKAFGVEHGLEFFYAEGASYSDTMIFGDLDNPTGTGIKMQHRSGPYSFSNTHVEGFQRGFETPRDAQGNVIENVYLNNIENFALINGRRHSALELTIKGDVQFGEIDADVLDGRETFDFVLEESESSPEIARYNQLILPYEVILDYDGLEDPQRVFFREQQRSSHVVWPSSAFEDAKVHRSNSDVPMELRDLTNRQLKDKFDGLTASERAALLTMLAGPNQDVFEDATEFDFAFGGAIRPAYSELDFPAHIKNGGLLALTETDVAEMDFATDGFLPTMHSHDMAINHSMMATETDEIVESLVTHSHPVASVTDTAMLDLTAGTSAPVSPASSSLDDETNEHRMSSDATDSLHSAMTLMSDSVLS